MIRKIKKMILEKFLDIRLKLLTDKDEVHNFPELIHQMKNVLVILPLHADELIQSFPSKLYLKMPQSQVSTFDLKGLRKSDCNWLGVPHEAYLHHVREGQFDLVIDINPTPDKMCSYITAFSGAPLRMNLTTGRYDHIYNLHVRSREDKNLEERLDSMIGYLLTLKNYYLANISRSS